MNFLTRRSKASNESKNGFSYFLAHGGVEAVSLFLFVFSFFFGKPFRRPITVDGLMDVLHYQLETARLHLDQVLFILQQMALHPSS